MWRLGVADDPLGVIDRMHWDSAKCSELDGVVVMLSKYLLGAA